MLSLKFRINHIKYCTSLFRFENLTFYFVDSLKDCRIVTVHEKRGNVFKIFFNELINGIQFKRMENHLDFIFLLCFCSSSYLFVFPHLLHLYELIFCLRKCLQHQKMTARTSFTFHFFSVRSFSIGLSKCILRLSLH